MKKSSLITTLTATAAIIVGTSACGSPKAAEKAADTAVDAAKDAAAHCGADKGAHEGSCAPGGEKPADPAPPPPASATP